MTPEEKSRRETASRVAFNIAGDNIGKDDEKPLKYSDPLWPKECNERWKQKKNKKGKRPKGKYPRTVHRHENGRFGKALTNEDRRRLLGLKPQR